ncbi:hypothetical protein B0O80DRAFT_446242 [Mortierella sp. GBAus27b]|nr:hypothetical protein B0O80DRAFT_446242 [Mortierella sp. GBAus27b]
MMHRLFHFDCWSFWWRTFMSLSVSLFVIPILTFHLSPFALVLTFPPYSHVWHKQRPGASVYHADMSGSRLHLLHHHHGSCRRQWQGHIPLSQQGLLALHVRGWRRSGLQQWILSLPDYRSSGHCSHNTGFHDVLGRITQATRRVRSKTHIPELHHPDDPVCIARIRHLWRNWHWIEQWVQDPWRRQTPLPQNQQLQW